MAGPFYNNIWATSSGAAGTGAFTPTTAVTGAMDWTNVPAGWIGLIRYEDGSDAELRYGYWDGSTITRPANGFVWSTTGSGLSLSSSATAAMVTDAGKVAPTIGTNHTCWMQTQLGANVIDSMGCTNTNLGTPSAKTLSTTNYLTEQPAHILTSGTAANNAAGEHMGTSPRVIYSTAAGRGGGEFRCRFGASQLPTNPKLWCGLQKAVNSSASEPSSYFDLLLFGKDSTDTNIQFMTNDGSGAASKVDTGIPLVANGWYEAIIWFPPGGGTAHGLLIRWDTGDIWYGTVTSDLPTNGSLLIPVIYGSLSATTGTAIVIHMGVLATRTGG